jgi:DNA-binding GntR family transcriptional regulator
MSGAYSPNERLVEAPLIRALGVGRNTLRTVLARLEQEGLVVLEHTRGCRVRAFSLEEAYDTLRVTEVLEGLIARLAAERATPEQRARLHELVAATDQAIEDDDIMHYTVLNRRFHELIMSAANSPPVAAELDALHFPLVKFQFQVTLIPGRKSENAKEHRALLRAIEARDADEAERAGRRHIAQVRATLEQHGPLAAVPAAGQTPRTAATAERIRYAPRERRCAPPPLIRVTNSNHYLCRATTVGGHGNRRTTLG